MFENDKELLRIFQLQFWTNFYGVVLQDFHAGVPQDFGQAEADIITRLRPKLLAKIFIVINSWISCIDPAFNFYYIFYIE